MNPTKPEDTDWNFYGHLKKPEHMLTEFDLTPIRKGAQKRIPVQHKHRVSNGANYYIDEKCAFVRYILYGEVVMSTPKTSPPKEVQIPQDAQVPEHFAGWLEQVLSEMDKWRKDNDYIPILPVPSREIDIYDKAANTVRTFIRKLKKGATKLKEKLDAYGRRG